MYRSAPVLAALLLLAVPISASAHGGAVKILGGAGRDEIDASARTAGIVLDESAGRLSGFEHLTGGDGDDDVLEGGSGRDLIKARDGARDAVDGGDGRDSVRADRADRVRNVERRS